MLPNSNIPYVASAVDLRANIIVWQRGLVSMPFVVKLLYLCDNCEMQTENEAFDHFILAEINVCLYL